MKNNAELLKWYKEEKAIVVGGPEVRTGLEWFPTFKDWKEEYVREYKQTHQTVDVTQAEQYYERVIQEAEHELNGIGFDDEQTNQNCENDEDTTMNNIESNNTQVAATADVAPTAPVAPKAPKKVAAQKDKVVKLATKATATKAVVKKEQPKTTKSDKAMKATKAVKATTKATSSTKTKADEARKVFAAMYPKVLAGTKARHDVIDAFVNKVGLTPNGASTYYQKLKTNYVAA